MRATMVIPSYWRRETALGTRETDTVYDHPTPLDEAGTLQRALESMNVLDWKDFELVVIAVANAEDIEARVEEKVADIIASASCPVPVHLFSHSHLHRIDEVHEALYLYLWPNYFSIMLPTDAVTVIADISTKRIGTYI